MFASIRLNQGDTTRATACTRNKLMLIASLLSLLTACAAEPEPTRDEPALRSAESALTITQLANPPGYLGTTAGSARIEPNWSTGTLPFSLGRSADWLRDVGDMDEVGDQPLRFDFTGMDAATPLAGQYPAGTVDWTNGNFNVAVGTPSLYIGDFWKTDPVVGQFKL